MTSANTKFTLCDIELSVNIIHLPNLNICVETSLINQQSFVFKITNFVKKIKLSKFISLISFIEKLYNWQIILLKDQNDN